MGQELTTGLSNEWVSNPSWGKDENGNIVRRDSKEIVVCDIFPSAGLEEKEIVLQSTYYSTSFFRSICKNENGHGKAMRSHLEHEIGYILNSSSILTGMKTEVMHYTQVKAIVELIILEVLPKATWLTKRQLPIIMRKGFLGQLTQYRSFSIGNLIDWIESYRQIIHPVLFNQSQYQGSKLEQPKKELTVEEKIKHNEKVLKSQLNIIKLILNNPYVFEKKELGSKLKDHFKEGLQRYLFSKKYNLNLAFDYLLKKGLIGVMENEIEDIAKTKSVQVLEGLTPPDDVANKYKMIYAKNEYMSGIILELIENKKGKDFIDKI